MITNRSALTRVEVLVLLTFFVILLVINLPGITLARQTSQRKECINQLRSTSLAFRLWANDHGDLYPMSVPVKFGGTRERNETGEVFPHFQVMSNELSTPRILVCPSDRKRVKASRFTPHLNNSNLSYFVGLDADGTLPRSFLLGDRHIVGGVITQGNVMEIWQTNGVAWSQQMHKNQGSVALADGSVQGFSSSFLRHALLETGLATNRLAMP